MTPYKISRLAYQDLEDIWKYTAKKWSIEQADRYTERIFNCITRISKDVKLAKSASHIVEGYFYMASGKHFVFFKIENTIILIDRVLHQQMDVEKQLK